MPHAHAHAALALALAAIVCFAALATSNDVSAAAAAADAAVHVGASSSGSAAARPHIFMMLADDWGSYDASYRMKDLGRTPDINTPNIDSLGATGIRSARPPPRPRPCRLCAAFVPPLPAQTASSLLHPPALRF